VSAPDGGFLVPPDFLEAMRSVARAAAKMSHDLTVRFMSQQDRHRHRRRCVFCNPASHTPPMRADGHEYHRRQRARRRARRKTGRRP
jgi:hypothetical protein